MTKTVLDLDDPRVALGFLEVAMKDVDPARFILADRIIGDAEPFDKDAQAKLFIPEWMEQGEDMCVLMLHLAVNRGVPMSQIDRNVKCRKPRSRDVEKAVRVLQRTDSGKKLLDSLRVRVPALVA